MESRKPIVAGQFYPNNKDHLERQIDGFFDNIQEIKLEHKKIYGGIVPHAGYDFSGQTASYLYKLLENKKFDLIVILGTNHSAQEDIIVNLENFETPFGNVKNSRISKKIFLQLKENFDADYFENEHSIEVQLPFLQYLYKDNLEIVPILIRIHKTQDAKKIAQIIYENIKHRKKILVLVSGDFTHYGFHYNYAPFKENILENIKKIDIRAINEIEKLNSEGFLKKAKDTTICGKDAIAVSLELVKLLGAEKAKLLNYSTSSEITKDESNVVSYASLVYV